jgi:hypothetical protein
VDPFAVVLFGGLVAVVAALWVVGRSSSRSGLEPFGIRSAREIAEKREQLEAEDLEQMLAAHNARRLARGEPELTAEDLEVSVMTDLREQRRRHEEELADRDLDELLELTNARRRRRGLPERTREQAREELGGEPSAGC